MKVPPAKRSLDQWFAYFNTRYFVVFEGGVRVVREMTDHLLGRRALERLSFADFHKLYQPYKFNVAAKGERPYMRGVADLWLDSPTRRYYERVTFAPGRDVDGEYNLWRGFNVKAQSGDWSRQQDHWYRVLCGGNVGNWQYVRSWLADLVQHPGRQGEVAIAIRGPRGCGKSMAVRAIGKLLGQHFIQVANGRHLFGNFNAHLQDAVLVFADEAIGSHNKAGESTLKMLITEPIIPIERKGQDVVFAKNCAHLILASNNEWIVPAGVDERRFLVLDALDSFVGNRDYFKALNHEIENGGLEAMLYDLLAYDLSDFEIRDVPTTEALREQKLLSMKPHEKWWLDKLMGGRLLSADQSWRRQIHCEELQEDYAQALGRTQRSISTATELGMALSKLVPGLRRVRKASGGVHGRYWHWEFPTLAECRASFDKLTKSQHPWPKEDE